MKTLFYEFLIETGTITASVATEALITQLRSTPSPAEIVSELGLMSKEDLLKILTYQQKNSVDFYSGAKELNLWSEDIARKINDHLYSVRRPISEILIEKGYIALDTLATSFDAYVGAINKPSQKDLDSSPTLDTILVQEYVEFYQHKSRPAIEVVAKQIKNDLLTRSQLHAALKQAHSEFTALWAAAKFLGAAKSEDIAHRIVHILKQSANRDDAATHSKTYSTLFSCACHVLDGFMTKLADFNNESCDPDDTNMSDLLSRFDKALNAFDGLISQAA